MINHFALIENNLCAERPISPNKWDEQVFRIEDFSHEKSLEMGREGNVIDVAPTILEGTGLRGASKPETLSLIVNGAGTGSGDIKGPMAFGMNSGIPFIKIADRVEVTVDILAKRTVSQEACISRLRL